MTPISSVTAFLARASAGDADWRRVFVALDLDPEARAAAEAQAIPAADRLGWIAARTGRPWTAGELARGEARAFVAIRRQLQARRLLAG